MKALERCELCLEPSLSLPSSRRRTGGSSKFRRFPRLTEAVSRAQAAEEIYEEAMDGLQLTIKADRASILLFDDDQVLRFKAWRGLSDS